MQIAVFTECYHPIVNGVVVSVSTFARELRKQGHRVDIYAPAYPGHRDREPYVHRLPSVSLPTHPRYPLAIPYGSIGPRRALARNPPDVVHAQHPFLACREGRRLARRLDCPLVFTYHTLIRWYAHYVPLPRPLASGMAVWISREYANSADCVVAPSQAAAEILLSYGVRRRIEVIPTGVDLKLIQETPRSPARARYGIPQGAPLIAYAGRIAREKNMALLIRAFAILVPRLGEAHLLFIGGGPWQGECQRLAAQAGLGDRVHFTGYLPQAQVFDCLADSDVFAFPSLTDTQGVAVLEAMALGCPPVAVRSGAVAGVVRDGVDGLLVEPTSEGLAEGLKAVMGSPDLRARLTGQAKARAEEFSAGHMAERLAQVYASVLRG